MQTIFFIIMKGNNMSDIFFATDFSESSKKAGEQAKKMANAFGANLHIIHVFNGSIKTPGPYHSMPGSSLSLFNEYIDEAREKGKKALEELKNEMNAKESYSLEGDPGKKIVEFTKNHNVDVLVVGSHGYGMIDRVLLGSVTDYIIHNSQSSVFVVKNN